MLAQLRVRKAKDTISTNYLISDCFNGFWKKQNNPPPLDISFMLLCIFCHLKLCLYLYPWCLNIKCLIVTSKLILGGVLWVFRICSLLSAIISEAFWPLYCRLLLFFSFWYSIFPWCAFWKFFIAHLCLFCPHPHILFSLHFCLGSFSWPMFKLTDVLLSEFLAQCENHQNVLNLCYSVFKFCNF